MDTRQSRRLFLRGAGTTLALPFLPSALWSRRAGAAACTAPRRFMAWFVPNGMNMQAWTPNTTDGTSNWPQTPILQPLEPIRKKIAILTGLDHQDIAVPNASMAVAGPHAAGTGCFLNMISVDGHLTDPNRTSLDQALLPVLNRPDCTKTRFPSLQIGVGDSGLCEGTDCSFSRSVSWSMGAPLPNLTDPGLLFDKMFLTTTDAFYLAEARQSVLDSVVAQAKSLSVTLSPPDRHKLDEHTTLVRNIETRLQRVGNARAGSPAGVSCVPPVRPSNSPTLNANRGITPGTVLQQNVPILLDLMAIAFQCDITRAITFMMGSSTSNTDYEFLTGNPSTLQALSQNVGSAVRLADLLEIGNWEIQQAATLLQRLDGMMEFDGRSILDHTTFYLSSDVSDALTANHWDMPVLIAGGASGGLKIDGRHINYIPQMPFPRPSVGPRSNVQTGRVFISILQAHGIMQDTFGMATGGPLPELMP